MTIDDIRNEVLAGLDRTEKPRFVYTRRRDRILAVVWPSKRKQLAQMRAMSDYIFNDEQFQEVLRLNNAPLP